MGILYRRVLKPVLFQFNPDSVHNFFIAVGEFAGKFALLRWFFGLFCNYSGADISKTIDGITYRTPIILAAGFDPDGCLTKILPSFSFGGEEIGSVTAHPCEGNPRPWFTRLVRNKSIVVYKGLRNCGVDALIKKLSHLPAGRQDFILGISIARTNDPSASADTESGIMDYVESFKKLNEAGIGDYYAINISCPNAHTGETFTDPKLLAQLLSRLRRACRQAGKIPCAKPVYLKMPISISWEQFAELADIADENGVQGLIIGNTDKNYADLDYPEDAPKKFRGGLSGAPCFARSNELIRKMRVEYGARFTIIGAGGILTPDDAMEKLAAGADLVQLITGMIFTGPGLIKAICERISETR